MNESVDLPGLDTEPACSAPPKVPAPTRARVKPVDRSQMLWRAIDVEQLVEEDHPARAIWTLSGQLALESFYVPIEAVEGVAGRTPWDPRLLISLWVYAYSRGISSAREVERRCEFDPAFQWLCGMESVNHHTLSDFRVAHDRALKELFVQLLGVLSAEGLISLERVMHDGTKIRAAVSRQSFEREQRLGVQLQAARELVESLSQAAEQPPTARQAAQQRAARERQQRIQEALKQLEQIRVTKRGAQEKEQARASTTDPECRVMKQADGGYAPSYNVQISTEASHKIVVAVSPSQQGNDYAELAPALAQVTENLAGPPKQVVVDGGFSSRENIVNLAAQGIELIGSFGEQEAKGSGSLCRHGRSAEFGRAAFEYNPAEDTYRCPAGQLLRAAGQRQQIGAVEYTYRAEASACQACRFKAQCCPQTKGRSLVRVEDGPEVERFRQRMQTAQAREIYRQRAPVAEFPNAWIKEKIGLRRFRLRGLAKVGCEALWACLTYNIQQWIRLCWLPKLAVAPN